MAGFPLVDVVVTLIDGTVDTAEGAGPAFVMAAGAALREAMAKAGSILLEPIMNVEILTPDVYMGDVIGDLGSRRGQVTGTDQRGNVREVIAKVPLATLFGYVSSLRSMSQGRARYPDAIRPLRAGTAGRLPPRFGQSWPDPQKGGAGGQKSRLTQTQVRSDIDMGAEDYGEGKV